MIIRSFSITLLVCLLMTGCSTRDIHGSLSGSTAQRLVAHSIDDLVRSLDDRNLQDLRGKKVFINSYFLHESPLKSYADNRLATELAGRFGAEMVTSREEANRVMTVFYTSLGTDLDNFGITIPLGYIPGLDESSQLNIITLEKFHGIAELYYYVGSNGVENRSQIIQAKVRTDALGLPFITIPLSNVDRHD